MLGVLGQNPFAQALYPHAVGNIESEQQSCRQDWTRGILASLIADISINEFPGLVFCFTQSFEEGFELVGRGA